MSDNTRSPSTSLAAAEGEPQTPVTPTVTHYQQQAIELTATLDSFRGSIPGLERASAEMKAFVKRKKRIRQPFVKAAVGSLSASPDLQGLKQVSSDQSTDDQQYIAAMNPLAMTVINLGRDLQLTVQVREARLATTAQVVYAVARGLALNRGSEAVVPFLETMKRSRTRRPKASKEPEPPSPLPVPPASAGKTEGGAAA
jgi:hypothetical protein